MTTIRIGGSAAALLGLVLLGGCGNSSAPAPGSRAEEVPAVPPGCDARYGNPPRPQTDSANGAQPEASCDGGEKLTWTDGDGTPRYACLHTPSHASATTRLPLLVWLHPSLFTSDVISLTGLMDVIATADLSGDPARPGFVLLMPAGRDTEHYYPTGDDTGLGWDNWYRNFDRSDPAINVDAATIDRFMAEAMSRGNIDPRRVYLSGWSNGSAMSLLYALNTPGIAAAAVYSSPDPWSDFNDPCPQPAGGPQRPPIMHVHNDCDVFGICQSGEEMHAELAALTPALEQRDVIIDGAQQQVMACLAQCERGMGGGESYGTTLHLRWPTQWNEEMLTFLREHPLP